MAFAVHPAIDGRSGRCVSGGNILSPGGIAVSLRGNALPGAGAIGTGMGEEIIQRHIFAVALGGGHQFEVYLQGSTASQNTLGVNQINDCLGFWAKFLVEDEGQVKQVVAA